MYIETQRMVIRWFLPEDAGDLHDILGDEETMRNCEPPFDFKKTQNFLNTFCIAGRGAMAAVHKETRKVIGYILFNKLEEGTFEMGWIFNRSFWRQGFAYEACRNVMEYAFQKWPARKVVAETIDTVKSVGMMRKLGMRFEGIKKVQSAGNSGPVGDLYLYSLDKSEWERINKYERFTVEEN